MKNGNRLQCGEDRTPPLPVFRGADPVEVVAGTDDAGNQGQRDDHVQPFLDHLAVHAGDLDQHEGKDGTENQLPDTLYPEVHHPPPVELVQHQVIRHVKREQEEHRQAHQAQQQHQVHHGLAALQYGHADVEQERQRHHHDADLGDGWLLQELPAHGRQQIVHGDLGQRGIGHQQVAGDGRHRPLPGRSRTSGSPATARTTRFRTLPAPGSRSLP